MTGKEQVKKMKIAIVMGSASDMPVMKGAVEILHEFEVEHEVKVFSAHRTPVQLEEWVKQLRERGFGAVIAAAGWAAHLAGIVAAYTTLPVIGVPIKGSSFEGMDSLLSVVQMPSGIPVATVAVNGSKNAALLALEMQGVYDPEIADKLADFRCRQTERVLEANASIESML